MSGQGMKWRRAKPPKPTQYANASFPQDALGQRAKAAFEAWRQTLTPRQRRSLSRPPRR